MRRPASQAEPIPTVAVVPVRAWPRLPAWLLATVLMLVTMALYWPAMRCDFVTCDDYTYVIENTHVTSGLTLGNALWLSQNSYAANWHPVTWLSHMLDCRLFGLYPWGHHLTNVLLHALNAGLVFALLRQMTGATWRSLLAAALFAVHPLRVESVAWVSERKDVLSGFFGLLALMAYAGYAKNAEGRIQNEECGMPKPEGPKAATPLTLHAPRFTLHGGMFYLLSLFLFALGLMSKPMLVTWPFVMLLLDYWPLGRIAQCGMRSADLPLTPPASRFTFHVSRPTLLPLVVEKIPFFVLAALVGAVTFVVQRRTGSSAFGESLPLGARIGNVVISYCRHLGKLFWPTDLAAFYPHPGYWPLGQVLLAGGLILGLSGLLFVQRQRFPFLLVGWLWFCGMLLPVIGLVQTGDQAMADRHTYLPSLGVLILAVWGTHELTRRWRHRAMAMALAGGAATALCLALTRQQIGYWKDGEALFRHALEVTENNAVARNNLGDAVGRKGQTDDAIRQYQEAIRLKPLYALAHSNLGSALSVKGQTDEAIQHFQEAIRLKPDLAYARNSLGIALGRKGQMDEATRQFEEAVRLEPDYADAHYNLGVAFHQQGRTADAIRQFQEAVRLKPDYAEAHNNLGTTLGMQGRTDEAIGQFVEALKLRPGYADARKNLDLLLGARIHLPPPSGAATNR